MAVIHDMMPAFQLFQPADAEGAVALLGRHGDDAWALAGGLDSFDWFKDRVKRPKVVVDLGGIEALNGIRSTDDGLEIGALTTLTKVATHPELVARYGVLAQAAGRVASPQIRNAGTIGGNVCQDTRCGYYRSGWPCYRAGGNVCYASSPVSLNREHCIMEADRCVAVNASDTAPALIALAARMIVRNADGEREIDAEDFFIGPGTDITRMNVLGPEDLVTAIRIPATWAGAGFYFEKVADRKAWDFPLMNVASAMVVEGGTIRRIRLAVGGAAARPLRLRRVEEAVVGRRVGEETGVVAGQLAVQGAEPLQYNEYKVALMRNLVQRAIRGGGA